MASKGSPLSTAAAYLSNASLPSSASSQTYCLVRRMRMSILLLEVASSTTSTR
eukprot:CAMPEP_0173301952 /NCGR_PEP_ID=MMETSP1143-20121109/18078_1 /TAXON_ID=483371 /ORGANISM="non described non described, Strain CCMP2298" /LENGTH=52 /DNA_ID=CAMNT_0014242525 /DNA_START=41 /DNA_END=199 /DNA_ORIENTATION=+